ncbi:MAG: hypothetical protein WD049_06515 [Candidatus Paceibacterota bacterium]
MYIDDESVYGVYWWMNGVVYEKADNLDPTNSIIDVRIPLAWHSGETYNLRFAYTYGDESFEITHTADVPENSGVWHFAAAGGETFVIRETAGIERNGELVELDVTGPAPLYPDPHKDVRATVLTARGEHKQIPVQINNVTRTPETQISPPGIYFKATVALDVPAGEEQTVMLWHAPTAPVRSPQQHIELTGGPIGGILQSPEYRVELHEPSGQLLNWTDQELGETLTYNQAPADRPPIIYPFHYAPDAYDGEGSWSHTSDWEAPDVDVLSGPLFVETVRRGTLPGMEEVYASVHYRFPGSGPFESSSVIRVTKDVNAMALRNGSFGADDELFTHVAWPTTDGSVKEVPLSLLKGNDTGAPPAGKLPIDTPWVAYINKPKGYAFASIVAESSYFNETGEPVNRSGGHRYVSMYRGWFVYSVRALNITYQDTIRTLYSPIPAGTVAHLRTVYTAFSLDDTDNPYEPVITAARRARNPLILIP